MKIEREKKEKKRKEKRRKKKNKKKRKGKNENGRKDIKDIKSKPNTSKAHVKRNVASNMLCKCMPGKNYLQHMVFPSGHPSKY